jgi:sorbitol/mannitol transport system substrate-binding protein
MDPIRLAMKRIRPHRAEPIALLLAGLTMGIGIGTGAQASELVIATVDNAHMLTLQRLATRYEQAHPGVHLRWVTLEEGPLRQQVTRDITTRTGQFDIVTVGAYEVAIWARKGWLAPIQPPGDYALDDLLPPIRASLSLDGKLFALPFYGEASMTMVRSDLMARAGITLPPRPSWAQIAQAAARMHDPAHGTHGICLRGKPGWGENMAIVGTMVNAYRGQWFNANWQPQLDSRAWRDAVHMYLSLLRKWGPPGAGANGYNENLNLFMAGHCAIWVDATVAGGQVSDPSTSMVAGKVTFLPAPRGVDADGGNHWLWTWALALPRSGRHLPEAQAFIEWATSKAYVQTVATTEGWSAVPSGTRQSTYAEPAYRRLNPHADIEQQAIETADAPHATAASTPYLGVQYVPIPAFQAIGNGVGQLIADALRGKLDEDDALSRAQELVRRQLPGPPSGAASAAPRPAPRR